MKTLLQALVDIFNIFHRTFSNLSNEFGLSLNDKALHFYVIGFIFYLIYLFINPLFNKIGQYSIRFISFIYVLTMTIVVSIAIEVAQFQSKSGQMELMDVIWSVAGFIFIWLAVEFFIFLVRKLINWFGSRFIHH
jgi:hypothetical protein